MTESSEPYTARCARAEAALRWLVANVLDGQHLPPHVFEACEKAMGRPLGGHS